MDPALQEYILNGTQRKRIQAITKLKNPSKAPAGMEIISQFGQIATCRIPANRIRDIWSDELTISLKAAREYNIEKQLNVKRKAMRSNTKRVSGTANLSGKGVVVGIVDWGFDFTHPNFLDAQGKSRFAAIWDQSSKADSQNKYGYGKIFRREAIDHALSSKRPFETLGYHPAVADPTGVGAHGTHVLDIAAGSGHVGLQGVAPEATLIAVHLSSGNVGGRANLGDSVGILEAIDFIRQEAGDRPLVINLSVGKHGGAHQGNSLVEQGMDAFLTEAPGRAIVQSTGNYYRSRTHASGRVLPERTKTISWLVEKDDLTGNELEVWYDHRDEFSVTLIPPRNYKPVRASLGNHGDILIDGKRIGRIYHRAKEPNTGDHHINIFLYPKAPSGQWKLQLGGKNVLDGRYHAWIERDGNCPGCQSRFLLKDADPTHSTGTICNGLHTIAVGALDNRTNNIRIADFSSSGPTADGRVKPNVLAPGVQIKAARSAAITEDRAKGKLAVKSGTSMAAPVVSGTVALLFEAAKNKLDIHTTKQLVIGTAQEVKTKHSKATYRVGNGLLNARAMLAKLELIERDRTNTPTTSVIPNNISAMPFSTTLNEQHVQQNSSQAKDSKVTSCPKCNTTYSIPAETIGSATPYNYSPVSVADIYRCAPTPINRSVATGLPRPTNDPDAVITTALTNIGCTAAELRSFRQARGYRGLRPFARVFGDVFADLIAHTRYSKAWILRYPGGAVNGRRGVGRAELFPPRLLLAVVTHFRELARQTTNPREAYICEVAGWTLQRLLRGAVEQATGHRWWIPTGPNWVIQLPAFGLGNISPSLYRLLQQLRIILSPMQPQVFNQGFVRWRDGLAGQHWRREVGLVNGQVAGLPFYSDIANWPATTIGSNLRTTVDSAWSARIRQVESTHPFSPGIPQQRQVAVMNARTNMLTDRNLPNPRSIRGLFQRVAVTGVQLLYNFPHLENHKTLKRSVRLASGLSPLVTRMFAVIHELGWNDLLFDCMGSQLFRGIVSGNTPLSKYNSARRISNHSYGLAFDVNTPVNKNGRGAGRVTMDPRIVALFESAGFRWGQCFGYPDPHHFEYTGQRFTIAAPVLARLAPAANAPLPPTPTEQQSPPGRRAVTSAQAGANANTRNIRQIQDALITLGFRYKATADGIMDAATRFSLREFQIYAKMPNVAREGVNFPAGTAYVNRLTQVRNTRRYTGRITGSADTATINLLNHWLQNRWRCPVVIQAWTMRNGNRSTIFNNQENIWRYDQPASTAPRIYARDFSGYYNNLPTGRGQNDYRVIGDWQTYSRWQGPRAIPPNHSWSSTEVTPEVMIGSPLNRLTAAQRSTFKTIRAVSEVECYGHLDSLNAYDNAFVSYGPFHYILGNETTRRVNGRNRPHLDGGELVSLLAYYQESQPNDFATAFGFFGLEANETWNTNGNTHYFPSLRIYGAANARISMGTTGWSELGQPFAQGLEVGNYLRSWHWIYRWQMAIRTIPSLGRSTYLMNRSRLRDLQSVEYRGNLLDRPVDTATNQPRNLQLSEIFTSERAWALLLRWHVRYPAHMVRNQQTGQRINNIIRNAETLFRSSNLNNLRTPSQWTDAHEALLIRSILDEARRLGRDGFTGSMERVSGFPIWATNNRNRLNFQLDPSIGQLATQRDSFQLDNQGLWNRPT